MAFLRGPINFMDDMLYNTCNRPFYIYVATAVPAFFDAWLLVRLWDFNDLVRARGKYVSGKGLWGTGRGKGHGLVRRGKAVPHNREKYAAKGLQNLLYFTQPLEYLGLALLMYGAVDNFYRDWMWYLDLADACIDKGFFEAEVRSVEDGVAHPNSGGNTVQLPNLDSDNDQISSGNISAHCPLGRVTAIFACTITGPGTEGANYAIGLRATSVLGSGDFRSETTFCPGGQDTDLIIKADILYPFVTGGQLQWVIYGPGVPVGLVIPKARVIIQRRQQAIG